MINKDVPTAFFMGNLAKRTSAGIIKNPPPAPTIPVNTPTTAPSAIIAGILKTGAVSPSSSSSSLLSRIILTEAASITKAKKTMIAMSFVSVKAPTVRMF